MVRSPEFRALADHLPEPLFLVSREGAFVEVNLSFGQLLDLPVATLRGQSLLDLVHTPELEVRGLLRRCAGTAHMTLGALTFRHDSGPLSCRTEGRLYQSRQADQPPLVLVRITPRQAASARFVGLNLRAATLAAEARRRAAAEARVREEREWLRVILHSIGDAVIATDASGRVTFMNAIAEGLTGWNEPDARGRPLAEVFHIVNERTGARVANPVQRVLTEGVVVGLANSTKVIRQDGTSCAIDDSAAPIRSTTGEVVGVVLVFRDITARRELERREEEAREALQQANVAKDRLLAIVSHELRNPLNAVLGWARLLITGHLDDAGRARAARTIEQAARTQMRLVEDLLDLSRMTMGRLRLDIQSIDLGRLLDAVATALAPAAEDKGVELRWKRPGNTLPTLGDPQRLEQAMVNIVANSIKFTPRGGLVAIEASRLDDALELLVRDSGQGIAPDFLPYVFEPFRQQSAGATARQAGLGLGMAIVRQLIELHGGKVEARSAGRGQGTTFVVRLPLVTSAAPPIKPAVPEAQPAQRDVALTGLTVLVVDDDDDSRGFLASLLRHTGADAVEASSVREAVRALERRVPDLILSDIGMPHEDGFAMIEYVLAQTPHWGRVIPAVAVTAFAGELDRERILRAGFHAHLAKPVDAVQLLAVVKALTGRRAEA